jgi:CheY-like chemotaxis protein
MSRPTLLLVDDDPDLGFVVSRLGRRAGCDVTVRADVEGGWDYLQKATPDLLLLDVRLPGVSGVELCRRVRASTERASLPVALFTHWGFPEDVAAGLEVGADFVFAKDLVTRFEDWRSRLDEILAPPHGRRPQQLLGWGVTVPPPPIDWVVSVNQALSLSAVRRLGDEVVRIVLRRVLHRALGADDEEFNAWLLPDGLLLNGERPPHSASPEAVIALVVALAEQIWCLLGGPASAPIRAALARLFPGGPELLPSR